MDKIGSHEGHGHTVVVAHFVEPDGFETVGFFVTEAFGADGLEFDP